MSIQIFIFRQKIIVLSSFRLLQEVISHNFKKNIQEQYFHVATTVPLVKCLCAQSGQQPLFSCGLISTLLSYTLLQASTEPTKDNKENWIIDIYKEGIIS